MDLPVKRPVLPMLAKPVAQIPPDMHYEAKWDGFRAIVFRDGDEIELDSRTGKPLTRYFPELVAAMRDRLPERCVMDGEIVIVVGDHLDFDALTERIHPAQSRVRTLAERTPASFVAFDLLAIGDESLLDTGLADRRARLVRALSDVTAPVHLASATTDIEVAQQWFQEYEGAGLDGVIAKPLDLRYRPDERLMFKIKHERTADCVVAGFRWHKNGPGTHVGSLLLGLYDDGGKLHHVGITSSFSWDRRAELVDELAPLRENAVDGHPWGEWAEWAAMGAADASGQRLPGATSRWNRGKDLSWEPLRIERVCEVKYDHMQGDRFRHAAIFLRWRPDKRPTDCRYDQLEVTKPYELARVFSSGSSGS